MRPVFGKLRQDAAIDSHKADGGDPPGRPPGFKSIKGVYFEINQGFIYDTKTDYSGSGGWEMMILCLRPKPLILGMFSAGWEIEASVSTKSEAWLIACLYKEGPSNPALEWKQASVKKCHVEEGGHSIGDVLSGDYELLPYKLEIIFQCGPQQCRVVIRAYFPLWNGKIRMED